MVENWSGLSLNEKKKIARGRLEERLAGSERELEIDQIDVIAGSCMNSLEYNCHHGFEQKAREALEFLIPYCRDTGKDKMLERARSLYEKSFK